MGLLLGLGGRAGAVRPRIFASCRIGDRSRRVFDRDRLVSGRGCLLALHPGCRDEQRVVGIFPNDAAVLRLVSAVVAEAHDEWQDTERRYLAEHTMALLYEPVVEPLDTKEVMPARIAS